MVYRARDLTLDEVVALKVVRPNLMRDAAARARFRSEIKLARRIRHRNVCTEMKKGPAGAYVGWLPKVNHDGGVRTIVYYAKAILPDLRPLSTTPREARIVGEAASCPSGGRTAAIGKLGGRQRISVMSAAEETDARWK